MLTSIFELRMPVDVALVYVDILSAGETLQGPWRLIRLLLLGRLWKACGRSS